MIKKLLNLLTILVITTGYAQVSFKKGYITDNNGNKIECLIKDEGWRYNPTKIEYKLSEDAEVKIRNLRNLSGFTIPNEVRFVKETVDVDQSKQSVKSLSKYEDPEYVQKTVLLKYLVEGEISLLSFHTGERVLYFYKPKGDPVRPLVYKSYLKEDNVIAKNETYQKQIWDKLKCESISLAEIRKLAYVKKKLVNIFAKYNEKCAQDNYINYENKKVDNWFDLSIRPGVNLSSLSSFRESDIDGDNGAQVNFRFGIEAEILLPFNENKWSIILEPTYQYFSNEREILIFESETLDVRNTEVVSTDYRSIEFPIGVRYHFHLNDKSKIFINASYVLDVPLNSNVSSDEISFEGENLDQELSSSGSAAFGIGFKFKNKYSFEFRQYTPREITSDYTRSDTKYTTSSFVLGYTIF